MKPVDYEAHIGLHPRACFHSGFASDLELAGCSRERCTLKTRPNLFKVQPAVSPTFHQNLISIRSPFDCAIVSRAYHVAARETRAVRPTESAPVGINGLFLRWQNSPHSLRLRDFAPLRYPFGPFQIPKCNTATFHLNPLLFKDLGCCTLTSPRCNTRVLGPKPSAVASTPISTFAPSRFRVPILIGIRVHSRPFASIRG
jgi:hypothetical protein